MLVLEASGRSGVREVLRLQHELFEEVEKARLQRAAEQNEPLCAVQLFCQFRHVKRHVPVHIRVENGLGGVQLAHVLVSPEIPGAMSVDSSTS